MPLVNVGVWWSDGGLLSVVVWPKWKKRTNDDHHDLLGAVVDSFGTFSRSTVVVIVEGGDSIGFSTMTVSTSIEGMVCDASISSGLVFSWPMD